MDKFKRFGMNWNGAKISAIPSKILARQHSFLLLVANQVLTLVALQKYWLKILVYPHFGLP
jgi:hypothetical protein